MNKDNISVYNSIFKLWEYISAERKYQYRLLAMLMIIASFAEIFSIGAVFPFLGALTSPDDTYQLISHFWIVKRLGVDSPEQLLFPMTILFCLLTLLSGALRLILFFVSTKLCFLTGADLSSDIYQKTLHQPYIVHINRNSSEIVSAVLTKTNTVIFNTIIPVLTLISSFVILTAILFTLVYINAVIAISTIGGLGLIYASIAKFTRRKVNMNGARIAEQSDKTVKILQEGLGNIRDILIDGNQDFYCRIFTQADLKLRGAQGQNTFYGQAPRYIIEAFGTMLIAIIAYVITMQPGGLVTAIPIIGTITLGAQRMLPVTQQIYWALSTIQGGQSALNDVLKLLNQKINKQIDKKENNLKFKDKIKIKNLGFQYSSESKWIIKDLNVDIKKGSRVGIIGPTGSGKSTFLDLLMGIQSPTLGDIYIDGVKIDNKNMGQWQKLIAHVPQSVYLTDNSIAENIALGIDREQIDFEKVKKVADMAKILETIEGMPNKFNTIAGERGTKLSGGQIQRLGIARALYKNAEIIFLDEATSALDSKTEESVMNSLENINKDVTIIIVAHRVSTLRSCDVIIDFNNLYLNE